MKINHKKQKDEGLYYEGTRRYDKNLLFFVMKKVLMLDKCVVGSRIVLL